MSVGWASLPSGILGLIFGCLVPNCGCGGGDGNVRLVCRKWRMCKVICFSLGMCRDCSRVGLDRILDGTELKSVRGGLWVGNGN